jgi:hypothetical protein
LAQLYAERDARRAKARAASERWFQAQAGKQAAAQAEKQATPIEGSIAAARSAPIKVERPTAEIIQFPANRIVRRIVYGQPADDMFDKYGNGVNQPCLPTHTAVRLRTPQSSASAPRLVKALKRRKTPAAMLVPATTASANPDG